MKETIKEAFRELWKEYAEHCRNYEENESLPGFWSWLLTGNTNY